MLSLRAAAAVATGDDLKVDTLEALRKGQRDGSISSELDAEATAHAIVVEGVGSAFLWTVDPAEDFRRPSEAVGLRALHEPILAAVRDRDEEAGRIAVLRHHDVMAQHLGASQA